MPHASHRTGAASLPVSRRTFLATAASAALAAAPHTAHGSPSVPAARPIPRDTVPIDVYLGATRSMVSELQAHRDDDYYLSTPFGNTGPDGASGPIDSWDCWHPNGRPNDEGESYMNCAGFIVAAMEACGADCDIVGSYVGPTGYNRGNKANLSRWRWFLEDHAAMKTNYASKEELLAAGVLHKGDLIIAEPNDWNVPGADGHVMVFWGDSPSEDLAWHSTDHADGVVAGTLPGNVISRITAKHGDCFWMHVPLNNEVALSLRKRSARLDVTDGVGNGAYSLAGAQFSVFESYEDGELSGFIASFSTDEEGKATLDIPPLDAVWVREDVPPKGFLAWSEPRRIAVGGDETPLEDEPCLVRLVVKKIDRETGAGPQGDAVLEGAVFELEDANGTLHSERTRFLEEYGGFVAVFDRIVRGRARLREASPPAGYQPDATGWTEFDLSPDSHEAVYEMPVHVHEELIVRGDICGAKYRGDSTEDSKTPLADCTFAFWLQDDGGLEDKGYSPEPIVNGKGNAVCDAEGRPRMGVLAGSVLSHEDGRFSSRDLLESWNPDEHHGAPVPEGALVYGRYTLVETACPDPSLALVEPVCDIEVSSQGQEVFFILEDRPIASPVRVKKIDDASGKPIAKPGTRIELLRKGDDGTYSVVEFDAYSPEQQRVSVFTVPASGIVQFPAKLPYGSYAVREVEAVPPYLLREEPVFFDVTQDHDWGEDDVIEVVLPNKAAEGRIEALKVDAVDEAPVAGAIYAVKAKHDVVTPDGTLHHEAGRVIASVTTDENGTWQVGGLSLGDGSATYIVEETGSPDGYVFETAAREVTLSYEDDATQIVLCELAIRETPCELVVEKKDAASGEAVEGVEIALYRETRTGEADEDADGRDGDDASERPLDGEKPWASATTDADGTARFLRLSRGATYRIVETKSRTDLGYPSQRVEARRYLSDEGLWYESVQDREDGTNPGERTGIVRMENKGTETVVHKADAALLAREDATVSRDESDEKGPEEDAAAKALLSGGVFRLKDAAGAIVPFESEDGPRDTWSASADTPPVFYRLVPGCAYTIEELEAPAGYAASDTAVEFVVQDDLATQVVVVGNDKAQIARTADGAAALACAAAVAGAGGCALLWYARRREALARSAHASGGGIRRRR